MTGIHSIMKELADAQRAIDAEPILEAAIKALTVQLEEANRHIAAQDAEIDAKATHIEELAKKLLGAEVARDEAQFRQLEADDKAEHALRLVQSMVAMGQDYIAAVLPPEPMTMAEVQSTVGEPSPHTSESSPTQSAEHSLSHPGTSGHSLGESVGETHTGASPNAPEETAPSGDAKPVGQDTASGQSEADPTATSGEPHTSSPETANTAETSSAAVYKPYAGKQTWDKPNNVTWGDFIDGGGETPYWSYDRSRT